MKITNNVGLPAPFVRMAEDGENYTPTEKRYSATTLLKPVREILLKRRHNDDIEQDCSDMIWLLFGTAVHGVLEKYGVGTSAEFAEEKLSYTLDSGYTVSGVVDFYDIDKGLVVDYKTASVWKVIYKDYEDWRKQGMTYAWLLRKNGLPVKEVSFFAILKDHSATKARHDSTYPQYPVVKVSFAVTDTALEQIEEEILDKLALIDMYIDTPDDELPVCSPEDRWNDGDKYAVMKKGRKTAVRVLDSYAEAEAYMAEKGGDFIETRKGEDRKCEEYCQCCAFCSYWRENCNRKEEENDEN